MLCMAEECMVIMDPEPPVSIFIGSNTQGAHWGHYCSPKCALADMGEILIDMINEPVKETEEEPAKPSPSIEVIKQLQLLNTFSYGIASEVVSKLAVDLGIALVSGEKTMAQEESTGTEYAISQWFLGPTIPGLDCIVTQNLDSITFIFDNSVFNFNISPATFNISEDYEGVKVLMTNILDAVKTNAFDM